MRRLVGERKVKFVRLTRERERHRLRRKLDAGARRLRLAALIEQHLHCLPADAPRRLRIPLMVPKILSLKDNYEETVKLISDVREYALEQYHPVDLFFNEVEYLEPAALTVLTAEIHRCRNLRKIYGRPAVTGFYPQDPEIYRQLQEIGFFKLLEIRDQVPPVDSTNGERTRVVLPFMTDATVTSERSAWFVDQLAALIQGAVPMDDQSKRYLQGAIIEAMKNAGEHAYKSRPKYQALGHRWWLTAAFDLGQREVAILLFDQGVGIPATLEPDLLNKLESLTHAEGLLPRDSLMIEIATRPGESSTRQAGRGQGFRTMRKFVDACDDGDLIVYSNHGNYLYARAGTDRGDRSLSLGGTLIQWRFRHSEPVTVAA
jgi:anti-sigma regulatory factor (Ser/Thr protein kinase)